MYYYIIKTVMESFHLLLTYPSLSTLHSTTNYILHTCKVCSNYFFGAIYLIKVEDDRDFTKVTTAYM